MTELERLNKYQVTSAELVRNFALARDLSRDQPVMITNHGRATHVLMSVDQYHASQQDRSGLYQVSNPLQEIAEWIADATIVCNRELEIVHINRVAASMIRSTLEEVEGKPLTDLPGMAGSHLLSLIQRANSTNEFSSVQLASPFAPDSWLEVRCFPWRERNVLFIRDITDRLQSARLADAKRAILEAMNEHGQIGYVRLSLRALIENADKPFADMVGLPTERLVGVPLVNLAAKNDRVALRDAVETVLAGTVRRKLDVDLVANDGTLVPVTAALAVLSSVRGIEGAVAVMTSRSDSKRDQNYEF